MEPIASAFIHVSVLHDLYSVYACIPCFILGFILTGVSGSCCVCMCPWQQVGQDLGLDEDERLIEWYHGHGRRTSGLDVWTFALLVVYKCWNKTCLYLCLLK